MSNAELFSHYARWQEHFNTKDCKSEGVWREIIHGVKTFSSYARGTRLKHKLSMKQKQQLKEIAGADGFLFLIDQNEGPAFEKLLELLNKRDGKKFEFDDLDYIYGVIPFDFDLYLTSKKKAKEMGEMVDHEYYLEMRKKHLSQSADFLSHGDVYDFEKDFHVHDALLFLKEKYQNDANKISQEYYIFKKIVGLGDLVEMLKREEIILEEFLHIPSLHKKFSQLKNTVKSLLGKYMSKIKKA